MHENLFSEQWVRVFICVSALAVLVFCSSPNLEAQQLTGTWVEPNYNITLTLNGDGTYALVYPNGRSNGRYQYNAQQMCLQDASGAPPVCYAFAGFDGNTLMLRDMSGITMTYKRQQSGPAMPGGGGPAYPGGGGVPAPPRGETVAPGSPIANSSVLAQKDGVTLTGEHFNGGLDILQFIIGQAVTPSEVTELKNQVLAEFNQMPGEVVRQLEIMVDSMKKIRTITDPAVIGLGRQQLFSALYFETQHLPEQQKPLLVQVMNRYIKVLAVDAQNKLLLTNKDVEAYMQYMAFNSRLAGGNVQLTDELRQTVSAQLIQGFPSMALEQKKMLCSASLVWQVVQHNWNLMSVAQQQQYRTAVYNQLNTNNQAFNKGYQSTTDNHQNIPPNTSPKSLAQQMADFNHRQQMYTIMQNMNTMSHVTSLNIIENIGGSDNYWKVVDY